MPQAGEIFDEISGGGDALGRCGHLGSDLAGSGGVVGGQNRAQIGHQRLLGRGGKASGSADLQPFDPSSPQRLVEVGGQDQLGHSGAQARRGGARPTVVHQRGTRREGGGEIHRVHHLDVVELGGVAVVGAGGAHQGALVELGAGGADHGQGV